MILTLLALASSAWADDPRHREPPSADRLGVTELRLPTWSTEFDAVLVVPHPHPGEPVQAELLLADHGTSAPIGDGTVQVKLEGAGELMATLTPGTPLGTWPTALQFPAPGAYHGSLTVITASRSDLLGLPEFTVESHEAEPADLLAWGSIAGGVACGAGGGLLVGLLLGGLFGRGRGATAARVAVVAIGVGTGVLVSGRGFAHGGDDHGAPAAPAVVGAGLVLPLDSQFLLDVRTSIASVRPLEERVRALGTTVAPPGRHAEIHAPVTGVVSLPDAGLTPGASVEAGHVLATIAETLGTADRSAVIDARTAAQVRLAQAKSALAIATRDLQQAEALGQILSGKEQLQRQQAVDVAREEVRQAEAATRGTGSSRGTVSLASPITGRIASLAARPGDVVFPGDVLFHVVGTGGLWVEARVPQTLAGDLVSGAAAVVESDAAPGVAMSATVLDPGLEADPNTGTLVVTLALDEAYEGLVPGMSVAASIVSGAPRDALTVPEAAVIDSAGESLVFVKTGPETFEARAVRLGARSGDRREIVAGVATGERVVVQGTSTLRSLAGR